MKIEDRISKIEGRRKEMTRNWQLPLGQLLESFSFSFLRICPDFVFLFPLLVVLFAFLDSFPIIMARCVLFPPAWPLFCVFLYA